MSDKQMNRLGGSTSPYLLQHADNPVHWWPWCNEALELARQEDKPILLSIGYSACHWCHVMAHESFEDMATADLMNQYFINIKVDREERPDLDKIYQTAHQLLSQRAGGWPLTVFLTPDDHAPFFAGTYFPKESRHGLLSFKELLQRIHEAYVQQRSAINEQNNSLRQAISQLNQGIAEETEITDAPLDSAAGQFQQAFDGQLGGFGKAPKFPHPTSLDWLLREGTLRQNHEMLHMSLFTLEKMAMGGVNDQLGGGFCRYSVDDYWMIPHFEKMLYDNGPLLALYADAWLMTKNPLFKSVCEETAAWVMREMQSSGGGYFSSLDADSEGEEGRFYVWDRAEVSEALTDKEYDVFAPYYGLERQANFEGRWHLHRYEAYELNEEQELLLASAKQKLYEIRSGRVRPGLDDKILTSWNALMIKGMMRAGRLLNRHEWIESAGKALDYILKHHWVEGRLLATSKAGHAHLPAYLDDYAFLIDALLESLETRWSIQYLKVATEMADVLLEQFEDPSEGGFFFTAHDHEALLYRPKSLTDDAMPSGNAVTVYVLQRLGHLLGETRYIEAADRALGFANTAIERQPFAHPAFLIALQESLNDIETLVVRGPLSTLSQWQTALLGTYRPGRMTYFIPDDEEDLPGLLKERRPGQESIAYLCKGYACMPPVDKPGDIPG